MKVNLVAITYRDSYFFKKYGPAVRDLQILLTLSQIDNVTVTLLDRPVSIYERVLGKICSFGIFSGFDIKVINTTSLDLIGPLRRRLWWKKSIPTFLDNLLPTLLKDDSINVFLDFMPIGIPSTKSLDGWIYWYDFIDNFTKHNRFTAVERGSVALKYRFVKDNAKILTFVSSVCLSNVCAAEAVSAYRTVVTNKVFTDHAFGERVSPYDLHHVPKFDFGFIGFVTDKIDIEFLARLAPSFTIAIYGDFYDIEIKARLSVLPNVFLFGGFHYHDVPRICQSFKVGLLPYREDKSHDGSPLKLYEYLRYLRPVLSSIDYELIDPIFIKNYKSSVLDDNDFRELLELSGSDEIGLLLKHDDFLISPMIEIIDAIKAGDVCSV